MSNQGICFYHIPNGGSRNFYEAVKFKRLGVKRGVPDICVPFANRDYHGLYIELKKIEGGKLSESQKEWGYTLTKNGYCWKIANGFEEAKKIVIWYMENSKEIELNGLI